MKGSFLQLHDVTAAYGRRTVLHGTTLDIAPNDFIIISGPNGGGKTTLLKILAGLLQPAAGRLIRPQGLITGYLPQYRSIDRAFPITVEETVLSGLNCRKKAWQRFTAEHREQVRRMLDTFQLTELAARPISALSGGQWQRTLLARSLACQPDLWLLDEPDTHLDAGSRDYLHALLEREAGRRAIVVVTHNPEHVDHLPGSRLWEVVDQQVHQLR